MLVIDQTLRDACAAVAVGAERLNPAGCFANRQLKEFVLQLVAVGEQHAHRPPTACD